MATLAGAQRTFQQRAAGVQQKFDLGTGKARFPGGYVPPVRRDGFRVDRVYYAPRISTPKGNATQAPQFAVQTLPERGVAGKLRGFVTTSGTQLMLNGMPWYCAGTNAYYAALKWLMSDSEVSVMMREHSARGATVLRVFAHSFFQGLGNSNSVPQPMMPIIGEYNEEAIRRLDLALAAASQNGIRLILVLGNYWPFLGGTTMALQELALPKRPTLLLIPTPPAPSASMQASRTGWTRSWALGATCRASSPTRRCANPTRTGSSTL